MTAEQLGLFITPPEQYHAAVEAWWSARQWRDRYRCPLCGRLERSRFSYQLNHDFAPAGWLLVKGHQREWCSSRHLATSQALWALRQDDPWMWEAAAMSLRKMAAALRGWERIP